MSSEITTPSPQPVIKCKYLRCKEMFHEDPGQPEDNFTSGDFWCSKTHEAFGPDGNAAEQTECKPARSCFVR